ncbi:uncharacterized protein si:dkey-256h2.1 isoform X2 [Phycodurus eques]|uniref:uncharacterized protein si:dkey-256h2.1 isoform X2 n=1 Tax=Phycodurus eques TaxID=693459 RepID=UPI002ACDD7E4|nr:uncharacterized protein si:dkey-256h2.1 isoform X2 [Phycodurus eques]
MLRSVSPVLYFLLVVSAHVTVAAKGIPRRRLKLADDEASRAASESRDNSVEWRQSGGLEPGEPAAAFTVPTLSGEFVYLPGAAASAETTLPPQTRSGCGKGCTSPPKNTVKRRFCPGFTCRRCRCLLSATGSPASCTPGPARGTIAAWPRPSLRHRVQNMAKSNASGVLVSALPGNAIRDMNCVGAECFAPLSLPAAMVHLQPAVTHALRSGVDVNVSFQTTPSPNFFIAIDQQGALAEMGWFLYPSFSFINWQAQWFDFSAALQLKLESPATVLPVFDKVQMQSDKGAVADVNIPPDLSAFDTLMLDASLSCPGSRDASCPRWDHTVRLFVCCDRLGPYCHVELGRWITAFRRGIGRWQTDVSPLLPVLDAGVCRFTMKTAPWAMPWVVSLNLRFSVANLTGEKLRPFRVMSLYDGGTFDKTYNRRYPPIEFPVPASTKKVELYAVITGHGSDDNGCAEFCVTSHHFLVNGVHNNTRSFDSAGSALGCAEHAKEGAVPNEHGTWLYGRGGWCDGLQVDPWRLDVTTQLEVSGQASNTIRYLGLFNGKDPDPTQQPGYIVMSSFLVFFK